MFKHIITYARMIKFSHTVFALPFALAAVVLAYREHAVSPGVFVWILAAMICARSAAMGFNRIVDARFDSKNPRTADRAIPSGKISKTAAVVFVFVFSAGFVLAAAMISRLCLVLSFPVLMVLFFYSYTKRFTTLSHMYLGFAISLAPVGAWIAVTGGFSPPILILALALMTYIAGFDILYACQDLSFDRHAGLYSIPARLGEKKAMMISAMLHIVSFISFFFLQIAFELGTVYIITWVVIGILLILEHRLVRPDDLSRIHAAFLHVNSAISLVLFLGILGDELIRRYF